MATEETLDRIQIVYRTARHHRTFHADGAWAAITPQLEVQVALFSDLRPLPDVVSHHVTPLGELGAEIENPKAEPFLVRETDVTFVMNKQVVNSLIELLQRTVSQIDQHIEKKRTAATEKEKDSSKV
jgi:uncharacterized lipoprotein YmbA